MVFDWFSSRSNDVGDLIARKKYSRAIEVMRSQFKLRPPGIETRLQFVDVLILAGRGKEAVPVLVGLADELSAEGQTAKAIGLLKRVEQIEPDREDVGERLAALVKKEIEAAAAAPPPRPPEAPSAASKVTFSQRVSFDMEEIPESEGAEAGPREAEEPPASPERAPAEQPAGEVDPQPVALEERAAPPEEPAPAGEAGPATEGPPEPERTEPAESVAADATAGDGTVKTQIRGAFRRFLSSLPGEGAGAEDEAADLPAPTGTAGEGPEPAIDGEDAPAVQRGPGLEAPLEAVEADGSAAAEEAREESPVGVEPEIEPEIEADAGAEVEPDIEVEPEAEIEAEAEPEVEPEVLADSEAAVEPDAQPDARPEPETEPEPEAAAEQGPPQEPELAPAGEPAGGQSISQEAFQGQLLDLIEEVVQQPLPPPPADAPAPDERPVRTRGVAESAQRLLASPLFKDLSEAELLAVVRGMRLHTYEAGDIVITEGEAGDSLFIVIGGTVRTFVRNPAGHNFEMGVLGEGDFFGELSSLSGRPRTGTVVATGHTELLELDKKTVDDIARSRPNVRDTLENVYIQRASSPEAAAIRTVPVEPGSRRRAIEVLEAYFGESRWDPRMRLRLADLLVKAGKEEDAVPLLVGLADDLDRAGFPEKAIAILKKIEKIRRRNIEEVNLAPLRKKAKPAGAGVTAPPRPPRRAGPEPAAAAGGPAAAGAAGRQRTAEHFSNWIVDVVRDAVAPTPAAPLPASVAPGYARGLLSTPLFEGLSEDELYAMIRELRLLSFDPGDIILSEGEPGESLFILTAGAVKVSVKNAEGRNVRLADLRAGSVFGEMATVSGKPRTATVTAAQPCELLELDRSALEQIASRHPRIREVLEELYIARATSPEAARARSGAPGP